MVRLYADENVAKDVVLSLRNLGYDVLTAYEAGRANQGISDDQVLAHARSLDRILVTNNRRDFIRLHRRGADHCGIVVYTLAPDALALANRIAAGLSSASNTGPFLIAVDGLGYRLIS